jgi:phosphoserine phosphatase
MPRTDPVLLFDLDGTILRRNSFPVWVLSLLAAGDPRAGLHARLTAALRVQHLLVQRKLRRLSHDAFMQALQSMWADIGNGPAAARLQARLLRLVRPNIAPALKLLGDPATDSLLATAAAAEYAEPLGRALGFHYVLATPHGPRRQAPCNSGTVKRERVLDSWIGMAGCTGHASSSTTIWTTCH